MRKTLIRLLSIMSATSVVTSNFAYADCPPAVRLRVGDKVTDCERIGLSDEADLKVKKDLIEGDFNKKIIDEQKRQLELKDLVITDYSKRSDLWEQEAMRAREVADKAQNRSENNFWLGILAGVALTLGAAWGYGQVAK